MRKEDIARVWAAYREPGFGTLSVDELVHVNDLVATHRPRSFVEVGTASGLSGGLIASMLDEHGGERFVTLDQSERFFADPSRETGFLLPEVYRGQAVTVERRVGVTSLDLVDRGETYDMAFVDAGHVHPWPLIDTLCVNLVLGGSRMMLHDDLTLYLRQGDGRAVGPKFLFDQFPESHRVQHDAPRRNTFVLSLDLPRERIDEIAINAFALPWTLKRKIPDAVVARVHEVLATHYSGAVTEAFDRACATFNRPNGHYWRQA